MKNHLALILFAILAIFSANKVAAQETIMNDMDYPFLQKLVNEAKLNYAPQKIRQQQVNIARTTYRATKLAWFDALSFSYFYNPNNTLSLTQNNSVTPGSSTGNTVNPNLSFGYQTAVTLNIGTLLKNPSNTKNAKANYNIALLEQQGAEMTLETQVRRLYITYVQANTNVRVRTQNAQDVATLFTQTKRRFEKNEVSVDQYSGAVTALASANQAKIDAEATALIAKLALEEVVGKKLEEVK